MPQARWLDEQQQCAWRSFLHMHSSLSAELARRLAADSPLSYPDYEVLVTLTDNPDGQLRMFELADTLGWEKSRVSHHVGRMANRGLVEKVRCDSDRRGFFVAVTEDGRCHLNAAAPGHVAAVRELFIDPLTPAQLDAITLVAQAVLGQLNDRP